MNINIKKISLPKGGKLELEYTEEFINAVREKMSIPSSDPVTDDDIRHFIHSAFSNAVNKGYAVVEKE